MPSANRLSELASEMDITDEQFDIRSVVDISESDAKASQHGSEHTLAEARPPCRFFAQKKCKKGNDCPFSHDTADASKPIPKQPCRNMLTNGQCSWGASCMFDHSMPLPAPQALPSIVTPPNPVPPICSYFIQGTCTKGQACTFSHTQPGLVGYMPSASGVPQLGVFIPLQATMIASPAFAPLPQSLIPLPAPPGSQQSPTSTPSSYYKTRPCRFFAAGTCGRGDSCSYIHEKPSARKEPKQEPKQEEEKPVQYDFDGEWGATSWAEHADANAVETELQNDDQNEHYGEGENEEEWKETTDNFPDDTQDNEEAAPTSDGGWGDSRPTDWVIDDLPDQSTSLPNRAISAQETSGDFTEQPLDREASSKPETKQCPFYLKGNCRYGSKCRLTHEQISTNSAQYKKETPPHMGAKFSNPCRHYRAGKCDRDDCRFSHTLGENESMDDTGPEDVNETVESWRADVETASADKTPVMPIRSLVLSTPPPDIEITHEHELIHRPKSFERKINHCDVLITAGCNIQKITTVYESAIVHLSQLPTGMSVTGLENLIKSTVPGAELKNCEMKNVPGKAVATFASPAEAATAARNLNGALVQARTIAASLSTQAGSMAYYPDTTVRITYKAPELHAYVYFPNVETARATIRVDKFKENCPVNFRNYTIQVHYESPGKRMSPAQPWHLIIKGVRLDSEDDREALKSELLELFLPHNASSVQIGQPSYAIDAPKTQILDLLRFKIGSLEDFEVLFPVNFQSSERRTAFAVFSNRNDATRAVQELDRYSQANFLDSQVKKNTLRVFSAILTKNRLPVQKYNVIESALTLLAPPESKVQVHVTLDDRGLAIDPNIRVLYLSAEHPKQAVELNRGLHSLLAGEVWTNEDGDTIWDETFRSDRGSKFFQTLNDSNPGTYIQCDAPKHCIRLFGEEEALQPVRRALKRIATRLQPQVLPLSPQQLDILLAGGLQEIRERIGQHVILDVYGKRLIVPFTFGKGDSGDPGLLLEEVISSRETDDEESDNSGIRHCMLCSSLEGPLVVLSCSHRFHFSCLKETILASVHVGTAPALALQCPANVSVDEPPCATLIAAQVIHLLLDEEEQMALFTAHTERYIQEHDNIFKSCPTPTCPGVYRVEDDGWWTMRRCPWCWFAFCASCGVRCHDGYNCSLFKSTFAPQP